MADVPAPAGSPPPGLVEIPPAEFGEYYFTRYGRRFPRHRLPPNERDEPIIQQVQLPCILPVDSSEMQRRTVLHNLLHLRNNSHTFGPFDQCMTPPENKVVLDIGSASGRWIEEVSEEWGHVPTFHGVEIVPRAATDIPRVVFEVYDFQREAIRQGDATVDVVHARFQNFQIIDWPCFLTDVARVLKPGGLFMSGECDLRLQYDNNDLQFPATNHLYGRVTSFMNERGYTPNVGEAMRDMLATLPSPVDNTPLFHNIGSETINIPIGRNHPDSSQVELAALAFESRERLAESLTPFMLSCGLQGIEVNGLMTAHRHELNTERAQMTYRMTWAQRR
ncbi:hypothetical protein FRC12_005353 [Ceratobasidium sp. 428]|nr:hypothetical protein FRC12_005353 [Ceratobasidium sp. 428]